MDGTKIIIKGTWDDAVLKAVIRADKITLEKIKAAIHKVLAEKRILGA